MISLETHKQYATYSAKEVEVLITFMKGLESLSVERGALYGTIVFARHLELNIAAVRLSVGKVPASVLFWLYRVCAFMRIGCPVNLPHICKYKVDNDELFFVTTQQEWAAFRETTRQAQPSKFEYVPHAVIQYLTRVKGLNITELMKDAPMELLQGTGDLTPTGRRAVSHGNHIYIVDGNVCITVLEKGMEII